MLSYEQVNRLYTVSVKGTTDYLSNVKNINYILGGIVNFVAVLMESEEPNKTTTIKDEKRSTFLDRSPLQTVENKENTR